MPITLRIVLIILTLIYLGMLTKKIKGKKLQLSFSIFWIITGVILIAILAYPEIVEKISSILGFEAPSNMLFVLTIFVAYYLIFELTLKLSQEYRKNVTIIQEISLLKSKVEIMEEKINDLK